MKIPKAMTIAGSDSGGGAGIQADLKTFAALGVYGASTLTAITAQNTVRVSAVHEIPTDVITAQIDAVLSDIGADAVKTGMLSSSAIIECVVEAMKKHGIQQLVVDPVMVAKSGDSLLREDAVDCLRTRLLPLAAVVTPNIPEAEALTGTKIVSDADVRRAAESIVAMGARSVVVKGGHREGPATDQIYDGTANREFTAPRFDTDVLVTADGAERFEGPRIDTTHTHGTGCTFASAVAAGLARGMAVTEAVALAKDYVTEAIRSSFPIGQGHGPLNHFYKLWE